MDFSDARKNVTSTPVPRPEPTPREDDVAVWFARGIALEEDPTTQTEAIAAYHKVLDFAARPCRRSHQSRHALLQPPGFRPRRKTLSRQASKPTPATLSPISISAMSSTKPDASRKPIQTYKTALQLAPTYADAHYNLALAYRKNPRAAQGPETLAGLHQARYRRPLVRPRPQPNQAHPPGRHPEASPHPPQLAAEFYKYSCGDSRPRLSVERSSTRFPRHRSHLDCVILSAAAFQANESVILSAAAFQAQRRISCSSSLTLCSSVPLW